MTRTLLRHARLLGDGPLTQGPVAVLVDGEQVAWVGPDSEAPNGEAPAAPWRADREVDLGGRLLTPAFVDAHVHLAETGLAAMGVDLGACRSTDEALELLALHARTTALGVVLGQNWDETHWPGGAGLNRQALDEAVGDRPAYVSRVDLHSAQVSTALVRAAHADPGLDGWSDTDPVTRDAHHAVRAATRALLTQDDHRAAIRHALQLAASRGIGTVHEMGAPHICDPADLATARELRREAAAAGRALPDVVGYWGELGATAAAAALGCAGAAGDLCLDGAVGSRTAAMLEPYADDPTTRGHLYLTADEVAGHVVACTEAGLQAGFHVIGDRATAELVTGLQKAAATVGADALRAAGHRLEHLEMVTPEQADLIADLGVTASVQPLFQDWWGRPGGMYDARLGARGRGMNPFGTLHRAGVRLAFGSDSPVTPFDPWAAVRAAVQHPEETERVTPQVAFAAHTTGGWHAAGRSGGEVRPGAPAYLAVWDGVPDGDPLAPVGDPDHPLPACALTLVAGSVAYDGGGLLEVEDS